MSEDGGRSDSKSQSIEYCKGCKWEGKSLRTHLNRTKLQCRELYDMDELKNESNQLNKVKDAKRKYDKYHNDEKYRTDKIASMEQYNQKNRDDINTAMSEHMQRCYKKKTLEQISGNKEKHVEINESSKESHQEAKTEHPSQMMESAVPVRIICNICDRIFGYKDNLRRHMREVHGEEKPFGCDECHEVFSRKCNLERHQQRGKHTFSVVCNYCDEQFSFKSDEEAKRKMGKHYIFGKKYPGTTWFRGCRWHCTRCIEFHCVNEKNVSDEKREVLLRRRLEENDYDGHFRGEKRTRTELTEEMWQKFLREWREDLKAHRDGKDYKRERDLKMKREQKEESERRRRGELNEEEVKKILMTREEHDYKYDPYDFDDSFLDPHSNSPMHDPVRSKCGHLFDRGYFMKHMKNRPDQADWCPYRFNKEKKDWSGCQMQVFLSDLETDDEMKEEIARRKVKRKEHKEAGLWKGNYDTYLEKTYDIVCCDKCDKIFDYRKNLDIHVQDCHMS